MADEQEQQGQAEAQKSSRKSFKAKTYWLPGPQPLYPNPLIPVRSAGRGRYVRFRNGYVTVLTEEEDEVVRNAGLLAFEEDVPKNRKVKPCPQCGYAPRSTEAREHHEELHPVI